MIIGGCHGCVVIVSSEKETPGETTNQRRLIDVRLAARDIIYCCVFCLSYDPPTRLIVVCVKQVSAETETGAVVVVAAAEEPKCCFVGRLVSKSTGKARELAKPTKK